MTSYSIWTGIGVRSENCIEKFFRISLHLKLFDVLLSPVVLFVDVKCRTIICFHLDDKFVYDMIIIVLISVCRFLLETSQL